MQGTIVRIAFYDFPSHEGRLSVEISLEHLLVDKVSRRLIRFLEL
jgi:hypothetical protein